MKIFYFLFVIIIIGIFILFSCAQDGVYNFPKDEEEIPPPPITTVFFEDITSDSDNSIIFSTNDKNMTTSTGSTFWMPYYSSDAANDYVETVVNKISGESAYGYGVIFWIQDQYVDGEDFEIKNFYSVLIRTDGYFQIIKVVNDIQHPLKIEGSNVYNWKMPLDANNKNMLNTGKNVNNKIRVDITDADADGYPYFMIYFNDKLAYEFEESYSMDGETVLELFQYETGEKQHKYGFIVTLSPVEFFPFVPVKVAFSQIYPVLNLN